jgi:septum site-determining protein MinC
VPSREQPWFDGDRGPRFEGPQDTHPPNPAETERRSCTLHRTLRSGAVVRFDGDLYVFGDVNPGAQVVATGNIMVLGALKGLAHAGAAGDEGSFILAFDLRPTQLRIGRKIAVPPPRRATTPPPSELATVQDGQIVIETYRGRVRA